MSRIKAGLAAIATEVLEDARKEAEAILHESEEDAKEILKTAKLDADKIYETIVGEATVRAETETRRFQSLTDVEKRNQLLQTKEKFVDQAFKGAIEKLKAFVKTKNYQDSLLELIEEAATRINSKKLVIHVNSADKQLLKQEDLHTFSKKLDTELTLAQTTEDHIGGCRLQTPDGTLTFDNTLENRLEKLKPTLRLETAKILFDNEVQENAR
jgi:V/A-type H+-transporting ATPase subunit E